MNENHVEDCFCADHVEFIVGDMFLFILKDFLIF